MPYCNETRNILDKFAGLSTEEIKERRTKWGFSVACINIERNINIGSLLRTMEIFGGSDFILIGRHHFDRRPAVGAQNYCHHLNYFDRFSSFHSWLVANNRNLVCVDRHPKSIPIHNVIYPENPVFLMGAEVGGIPEEYFKVAHTILEIPQFGALRSLNVGNAGAIVMHDYVQFKLGYKQPIKEIS